MENARDNFIIIDGNSLVNRAFYALPPMTAQGKPVQAVYGFATMLIRMIQNYKPKYIATAFDLPAPTFRHKMYDGYKATRKGMPDELAVQLPVLKEMLGKMGVTILEKEGYEADDIIGTLARGTSCPTYIVTGDRDSFQLIDDTTKVVMTKRGITEVAELDEAELKKEYGLTPAQVIEYKAIAGDSSDNIPGVTGIGDKGARQLLEEYGSLDGIYENLDKLSAGMRKKLEEGKELAYLSRTLATIDTNVPIFTQAEECPCRFPFGNDVRTFFIDYGFKSLLKRSDIFEKNYDGEEEQATPSELRCERSELSSVSELISVVRGIKDEAALEFGENGLWIAPSLEREYRAKFSDRLDDMGALSLWQCVDAVKLILENESVVKAVYDAKKLTAFCEPLGIAPVALWDVKLAQYVADVLKPNEPFSALAATHGLDPEYPALAVLALKRELSDEMKEGSLEKVFEELEMPLVPVLRDMEKTGFKLDIGQLDRLNTEYTAQEKEIEREIFELTGREFNIKSPRQLGKVLFEELGLPYSGKGKNYSTGAEILEPLVDKHPVIEKILAYRAVTKLNSTYVVGLKKLTGGDGIVHTDFRQAITATGRLSSAEPNLQNIPVRDERGKRLRALFTSRDGFTLVSADYSQIELRLLAHFSGDEILRSAYENGDDVHTYTAAKVFGVEPEEVTSAQRRAAKAVNFGIIYGISDFGLAQNVKISRSQAKKYIEEYFKHFPSVKGYLDESVKRAKECGYAETLFGRRRQVPELFSSQFQMRKFGERVAMNMPLQGSAADIIKRAMIDVHHRLKGMKSRLILQIHDELIVEAADDEADMVCGILKECMENAVSLSVPLTVDIGTGKSWIDC